MTVRRIVIPIRGDGKGENVLAHAAALARRYGAHVEALHCRARVEDLMPYGVPVPAFLRRQIEESAHGVADQEEAKLREKYRALLGPLGLEGGEATASWREAPGKQVDVIKSNGRLADIVVVAKPDRDRNLGANTLKAALFNTGRPVMMCPPRADHPATLCDRVAVAWNGSIEAARAVALTSGILQRASEVTVLSGGDEVHGATSDDLVAYLAARGVAARLERFDAGRKVGKTLLRRSADLGVDTLVMGAYGDSHERESVFGGNTQIVVDNATLPVIFVH